MGGLVFYSGRLLERVCFMLLPENQHIVPLKKSNMGLLSMYNEFYAQ